MFHAEATEQGKTILESSPGAIDQFSTGGCDGRALARSAYIVARLASDNFELETNLEIVKGDRK